MKKTFSLHAPGKADARVVESIKHDVRKYVKRERRKTLPEGFDLWEFACRVGASAATAETQLLNEMGAAIDLVVTAGASEVYLEITAVPAHRIPYVIAPVVTNQTSLPAASPAPAAPASPALAETQSS